MRFPRSLAVLGEVLDLRVERDGRRSTIRWNAPRWLCGEPGRQRLWIVRAPPDEPRPLADFDEDLAEAIRLYRLWMDLVPIGATRFRVRVKRPPVFRGRVNVIGYRSDKWSGEMTDWEHVFQTPPVLEVAGDVYRISGGALRVTAGGIDG